MLRILMVVISLWLLNFGEAHAALIQKPPSNLGLVGYWSMNEGAGTVAGDASGNGNRGILTNMAFPATATSGWGNGKLGKALNFDGVDDAVLANSSVSLDNLGPMTVSAWIRPNTLASNNNVVAKGPFSCCNPPGRFRLGLDNSAPEVAAFFFERIFNGVTNLNVKSANNLIKLQEWQHITVTWDGLAAKAGVVHYYNGTVVAQGAGGTAGAGSPTSETGQALAIGAYNDLAANSIFNGLIDEVRVYNRALSAAEIQALYKSGAAKFAPPSNTGLVGYWSMNEGAGTVAGDASGNGNRGTLTGGPTWVDGKRGKALNFDGVDDYTVSGSVFSGLGTSNQPYTLSAWIKSGAGETKGNIINSYVAGLAGWRLGMVVLSSSKIVVNSWNGATVIATSTTSITPGQWYHVVNTWDASGGLRIYINGAFDNSVAQAIYTASGASNVVSVALGALSGAAGSTEDYFNGLIDEVRVYNRALSAAEIQALYNSGAAKYTAPTNLGLVGYWSMNEGAGTVAGDGSGNGNRGTLTGGPTWVDGKRGKAVNFDGVDDKVAVTNSSPLTISNSITISAWIFPRTAGGSSRGRIVDKNNSGTTGYELLLDNFNGVNGLGLASDNATVSAVYNVITYNAWQHVVATQSGVGTPPIIYVNGVSRGNGGNNITVNSSAVDLYIGGRQGDNLRQFDGLIDEVRVYNRALTAAEIQTLYNSR